MNSEQEKRLDAIKMAIRADKKVVDVIEEVGISIADKPSEMPSRPGYKWIPHQTKAGGSITWIEEVDPDAEGTADKPITFNPGMDVYENYYYTDGVKRYVCIKAGNPAEIAEGDYFTEF